MIFTWAGLLEDHLPTTRSYLYTSHHGFPPQFWSYDTVRHGIATKLRVSEAHLANN